MAIARCIDDFSFQGCPAVCLENDHLAVTMLPESAGKVVEITNLRSGRNWLWSNASLPHNARPRPGSFDAQLDSGGWDEVLLSILPCAVRLPDGSSVEAPDHGDLVGRPWQRGPAGVDGSGNAYCVLTARGRAAHYYWTRKIVLERDRPRLRVEYQLENSGTSDLPFYWCAHPLLATEHGMRVLLPTGQAYRVDRADNTRADDDADALRWPFLRAGDGTLLDLSRRVDPPGPGAGFAVKVFVRSTETTHVAVECAQRRERLVLQYDPEAIPWLGLWINDRGWTGTGGHPYLNLGLEPSTASSDSLEQAMARDEIPILCPGETRQWWLELALADATAAGARREDALQ